MGFGQFFKIYWQGTLASLIILISSFAFCIKTKKGAEERSKQHFEFRTSLIKPSIEKRMMFYINVLKAGKGFFYYSDTVTRAEWSGFSRDLEIQDYFPGIQAIGLSSAITSEDLPHHIEKVRSEGFTDYEINPAGHRTEYTAIVYIEPFDWRNKRAFGFDMFTEPTRREAMEKARDFDAPTLSGKVQLIQETEKDVQAGFLIYVPFYEKGKNPKTIKERRKYLKGYVFGAFRTGDFMRGTFRNQYQDLDIEIYDKKGINRENLLYDSDTSFSYNKKEENSHSKIENLYLAGHNWTIYYSAKPGFGFPSDTKLAYSVLIAGAIISLLVFSLMYSVSKRREDEKISKNRLTEQNQELLRTNTDLDNFIYAASHDLKAPIANVEGLIKALKTEERLLSLKSKQIIIYMEASVERFKRTIIDLTDISLIQKKELKELVSISLSQMLDEVKSDLESLIRQSNAEIYSDFSDVNHLHFSRKNMRSILYNLVSNALKYRSPERNPIIKVESKIDDEDIILSVTDNGLGIDARGREKIFGMFKRMHNHVEGSGVGLFIVKRIVENAGGKIEVESEPGKGSTFKVYLKKIKEKDNKSVLAQK